MKFNDQFNHALGYPISAIPERNTIVSAIYPHNLFEHKENLSADELENFPILDSLCKQIERNDNPLIGLFEININHLNQK